MPGLGLGLGLRLKGLGGSGSSGGGGPSGAGLHIEWDDQSADEDGFRVYYGIDGITFPDFVEVGENVEEAFLNDLIDGQLYYFYVVAFNSAGESDPTVTGAAYAGTQPEWATLLNGIEAYWKLNETDTNTRVDSVGNNDLAAGSFANDDTGKIGNALALTDFSTEAVLSIADNSSLSFGDESMAIAGWFYRSSEATTGNFCISKRGNSANTAEWGIFQTVSNSRIGFYASTDGTDANESGLDATTFGALTDDTWYFFYAEHNAVANTMRISINDGVKDSVAHAGGIFDGTNSFRMGYDGTSPFQGRLDEIGIWRRILTDSEVTALYNAGAGRTFPFL